MIGDVGTPGIAPDQPHPLPYGPPLPLSAQRRFHRWIILAAIAIAILLAATRYREMKERFRLICWERQCAAHPIPAGIMVYSSGPPAFSRTSREFARFCNATHAQTFYVRYGGLPNSTIIYLGKRRASNGLERFIAVSGTASTTPGSRADMGFGVVYWPIGITGGSSITYGGSLPGISSGFHGFQLQPHPDALIYSAVEDQNDPSHFSFQFDANVARYTIDCWLQPNGGIKYRSKDEEVYITPQGTRGSKRFPMPGAFSGSIDGW